MPPKAASRVGEKASGVGDPAFAFVFSVLKHCEAIKPDWNEVAAENGIAYGKNATARFKSIVKAHGLEYKDGKLTEIEGAPTATAAATTAATTAAPATNGDDDSTAKPKRTKRTIQTARKRKMDEDEDEDEAKPATATKKAPAKRGKKAQPVVKEEIKAEVKDEDDTSEEEKVNGKDTKAESSDADDVKNEDEDDDEEDA